MAAERAGRLQTQRAFLDRLTDEYYDRIYKYALILTRSADDAADLAQDTFLTAAERAAELPDHPNVYGWLRTVVYHHFQHWRADRRREAALRFEPPEDERGAAADPIQQLAAPDELGDRLLALDMERMLSPEDCLLLRRIYFERATAEETARELGMSPAACRKRLQRIRERLRQKYLR